MPVHLSSWTHVKRFAYLAKVATVGASHPGDIRAWGPRGVKETWNTLKTRDANRDHTAETFTSFNQRVGRYRDQIGDDEYDKVQKFAMEYFQTHDKPVASFVTYPSRQNKLKRIEIMGSDDWIDLWTDV